MFFEISKQAKQRRKQGPLIVALMSLVIAGGYFGFVASIQGALILVPLFVIVTTAANWWSARKYLRWASSHQLHLEPHQLVFTDGEEQRQVGIDDVSHILVNQGRRGVASIVLNQGSNEIERLENYNSMDQLLTQLQQQLPHAKVETKRRWLL